VLITANPFNHAGSGGLLVMKWERVGVWQRLAPSRTRAHQARASAGFFLIPIPKVLPEGPSTPALNKAEGRSLRQSGLVAI
jgi:hypothetical protein